MFRHSNTDNVTILVIVVTYNSKHVVNNIYENMMKINNMFGNNVLFLIVDNGSDDGTYNELVKKKNSLRLSNVILIKNRKNFGFACACLRALVYARKNFLANKQLRYVILMNPDVKILNIKILKVMIDLAIRLEDNTIIGVASKNDKNIEHLGIFIDPLGFHVPILEGSRTSLYKGYLQRIIKSLFFVDTIRFFLVLIPFKVINDIGFLNTRYFMYMEDTEYCLRSWKAGYPCIVITTNELYVDHAGGRSSRVSDSFQKLLSFLAARNHLITICKHCFVQCFMVILMHIIGCKRIDTMYCSLVVRHLPKVLREAFKSQKMLICGIHNRTFTLQNLKKYRLFWLMKCVLRNLRSKVNTELLDKCWRYSVLMSSIEYLREYLKSARRDK